MLASAAPAGEVAGAQSRLIASAPRHAELSETAQKMLASAYAVTSALQSATGLDWSVAVMGLCKAVEVESVHRIAEPLRLAVADQDISAEVTILTLPAWPADAPAQSSTADTAAAIGSSSATSRWSRH